MSYESVGPGGGRPPGGFQEPVPPGQQPPAGQQGGYGAPPPGYGPGAPPPGYGPPGGPPPGYQGGYGPPPPGFRPAMRAAHKPGLLPLRPLRLGDIYDAAFRLVRQNAAATIGASVLVAAVTMSLPVLTTLGFMLIGEGVSLDDPSAEVDPVAMLSPIASLLAGAILLNLGTYLVTAMVSHVAMAGALGGRLSLGEAWAATRGQRWRTIGLVLVISAAMLLVVAAYVALWVPVVMTENWVVIVAWALLTIPALLVGLLWFTVRVTFLAVPALVLEGTGVMGALSRAFQLSRDQTWRLLGIYLATALITQMAAGIISFPISLIGAGAILAVPDQAFSIQMLTQAVATVVGAAFTTPFLAAVGAFAYLDQRIRKEAFDVELLTRAGRAPR